tara:strand:+ start:7911 stop:8330 length:420 start_codon:yes stop_codon:yes gene_type:complete
MKNYELTILLSPVLTQEQLQETFQQLTTSLQNQGAIVMSQDLKGRRSLLSPIKGNQEATLAVIKFTLDPVKLEQLKTSLNKQDSILRLMLLSWTPRKTEQKIMPQPQTMPQQTPEPEAEKVEVGDIDKKLEEIFKDELL